MRYQSVLSNVTVDMFAYWFERDFRKFLTGADGLGNGVRNQYEYDQVVSGFVEDTGCILSVWAYQLATDRALVDFEQLFGGTQWLEEMAAWLLFRFEADVSIIPYDGRQVEPLSAEQRGRLAIVRGWPIAKRQEQTQERYASAFEITARTLQRWRNDLEELGYPSGW